MYCFYSDHYVLSSKMNPQNIHCSVRLVDAWAWRKARDKTVLNTRGIVVLSNRWRGWHGTPLMFLLLQSPGRLLQNELVYPQPSVVMLSWEGAALKSGNMDKLSSWSLKWWSLVTSMNKITTPHCTPQLGWLALVCAVLQGQQHSRVRTRVWLLQIPEGLKYVRNMLQSARQTEDACTWWSEWVFRCISLQITCPNIAKRKSLQFCSYSPQWYKYILVCVHYTNIYCM